MLKVVFLLKHLQIKVRQATAELHLKIPSYSVPLATNLSLSSGQAHLNMTSEFYLQPNHEPLTVQVVLEVGKKKKIGGEFEFKWWEW